MQKTANLSKTYGAYRLHYSDMTIKFHPEDSRQIGMELKVARIRKGLKQWEIALKAGICQNTLSLIETGRKTPTPELVQRIQKALDET